MSPSPTGYIVEPWVVFLSEYEVGCRRYIHSAGGDIDAIRGEEVAGLLEEECVDSTGVVALHSQEASGRGDVWFVN